MRFGLIIRGQYPQGDDMRVRLREDLDAAKRAEELGYDLVAKGSHYSSHPFQYIQQIPYLCQVALVAPKLRLCPGRGAAAAAQPAACGGGTRLAGRDVRRQADLRRRHRLSRGGVQRVRHHAEAIRPAVRGMPDRGQAAVVGGLRHHGRQLLQAGQRQLHRHAGAEADAAGVDRRQRQCRHPPRGAHGRRLVHQPAQQDRHHRANRWRSTSARWMPAASRSRTSCRWRARSSSPRTRAEAIRLARPSLEAKYKAYKRLGPGQGDARRRCISAWISRT